MCGGGADFDRLGVFPLSLVFSSSVFLPSFQKGRFEAFPLPVVASAVDSVVSVVSGSLVEDLKDSMGCRNEPGRSGAIEPRDSVSLGCAAISLRAMDMAVARCPFVDDWIQARR